MNRPNILNPFSQTMHWAKPAHGQITLAAAIDSGTVANDDLSCHLSDEELQKAKLLVEPSEKRHFMFRRCFQRQFLHALLHFEGQVKEIAVVHQLDQRPVCLNAPDFELSFSSSKTAILAAASNTLSVGVDIEHMRQIENVASLANRFFTPEEAEDIARRPAYQQNLEFLKSWTAKEAGLKAIGLGIVAGLNTFVRTPVGGLSGPQTRDDMGSSDPWTLDYLDILPDHMVAVVHRPRETR